jgi:hypothetical protein
MYVCIMYVCMYVRRCMYVCMHVCMYVCMISIRVTNAFGTSIKSKFITFQAVL